MREEIPLNSVPKEYLPPPLILHPPHSGSICMHQIQGYKHILKEGLFALNFILKKVFSKINLEAPD